MRWISAINTNPTSKSRRSTTSHLLCHRIIRWAIFVLQSSHQWIVFQILHFLLPVTGFENMISLGRSILRMKVLLLLCLLGCCYEGCMLMICWSKIIGWWIFVALHLVYTLGDKKTTRDSMRSLGSIQGIWAARVILTHLVNQSFTLEKDWLFVSVGRKLGLIMRWRSVLMQIFKLKLPGKWKVLHILLRRNLSCLLNVAFFIGLSWKRWSDVIIVTFWDLTDRIAT